MRHHLRANGIALTYRCDGPETGQPIVLVHGGSLNADSWSTVIKSLRGEYHLHAYDQRGHGNSEWPGHYSYDLLADDVTGFVQTLGLTDVILIGHSLGGSAAMLAAQRRPDWLATVILEEPAVLRPGRARPATPARQPDAPPTGYDRTDLMASLVPQYYHPDPAWWDDLALIEVPVLYLVGRTADERLADDRAAAAAIPDCRYVTIPVGHHIHRDAVNEFLTHLRRFLRDVSER